MVILNSTGGAAVTATWSFPQRCTEYNHWMFTLKGVLKNIRMYL